MCRSIQQGGSTFTLPFIADLSIRVFPRKVLFCFLVHLLLSVCFFFLSFIWYTTNIKKWWHIGSSACDVRKGSVECCVCVCYSTSATFQGSCCLDACLYYMRITCLDGMFWSVSFHQLLLQFDFDTDCDISFVSARPSKKLTFVYLANDIIQNSKKKGPEFAKQFELVLEEAFSNAAKWVLLFYEFASHLVTYIH